MRTKKTAVALTVTVIYVSVADWLFYRLRCELSPPISVPLLVVCAAMVLAGVYLALLFRGKIFPNPWHNLKLLPFLLILMGTLASGSAMLRSDAIAVHGMRSSGDACF